MKHKHKPIHLIPVPGSTTACGLPLWWLIEVIRGRRNHDPEETTCTRCIAWIEEHSS